MAGLRILSTLLLALITLAAAPGHAKDKKTEVKPPPNQLTAKASADYLALPHLHVKVLTDRNQQYRALELEVWLLPSDPENLALARSAKKTIMSGLQEDFANYNWEAFVDAKSGPVIAKQIVTGVVDRVSHAKLQDVLIKTLLLM